MSKLFAALPGFYKLLFLYLEPISTVLPALLIWFWPGWSWFHQELHPGPWPPVLGSDAAGDVRTKMAIWQLGSCYCLLGMLEGFGLRAVRDALPDNPVAQERIVGATLTAMAVADVTHILATLFALPPQVVFSPLQWNATTHGNITIVIFLISVRLAWFAGIGRRTYYYSLMKPSKKD